MSNIQVHRKAKTASAETASKERPAPVIREQLLRVNQAAELLNLSPKTLWNWIYSRELEVIRIGRSVRIAPSTLRGIIENGRVPARIG